MQRHFQFVDPTLAAMMVDNKTLESLVGRESAIDELIARQLALIVNHPAFQALERSWRGLEYLVCNTETAADLQIKVLDATKNEVLDDFDNAPDLDRSTMWKHMIDDAFEMRDGVPFAAIVADYEFSGQTKDINLLRLWAATASISCTPLLSAVSREFFGLNSWNEINAQSSLTKCIRNQMIKWKSFRECEDSRFVYLTMPRTHIGPIYDSIFQPVDEIEVDARSLTTRVSTIRNQSYRYCWSNSAYVLALGMTSAYSQSGFCVSIADFEANDSKDSPPLFSLIGKDLIFKTTCLPEVQCSDAHLAELNQLGFMPAHLDFADGRYTVSGQSVNEPAVFGRSADARQANKNARVAARLPFVMATSRIAHFVNVIARDKRRERNDRDDWEKWFQGWISDYVSSNPDSVAGDRMFPFAEAHISVQPVKRERGVWDVVCYLRPWLPDDELTSAVGVGVRISS